MVIIEPGRDGVSVFHRGFISGIQGNVNEVCSQIVERTCSGLKSDESPKQIMDIYVVDCGIGMGYIRKLESYGLNVKRISPKYIDIILPKING